MAIRVQQMLVAVAACVGLGAIAAPAEQAAPAPGTQAKETKQADEKSQQKVAVGVTQPTAPIQITKGESANPSASKSLYFESWVKDEDAKDKKGTDALQYR